jgi:anti-anti-sigma factor
MNINKYCDQGYRSFVLNLADVPYIDSFGLGQLVTIWTSLHRSGGQLILLKPADHIRHLLQITKLDSVFATTRKEGEAVNLGRASFIPV